MPQSFLAHVQQVLAQDTTIQWVHGTLLCPSVHSANRIQHIWAQNTKKASWAPRCISLNTFLQRSTGLTQPSPISLVALLHALWEKLEKKTCPIAECYPTIAIWLNDFDYILQHVVSLPTRWPMTKRARLPVSNWQKLFQQYNRTLLKKGWAYKGLLLQEAYKKAKKNYLNPFPLAFIGFNDIAPALQRLINLLIKTGHVRFFWDEDAYYMNNPNIVAGHYLRANREHAAFQHSFAAKAPAYLAHRKHTIDIIGTPTLTAQAQVLHKHLLQWMADPAISFQPEKAAIVVANPKLLLPVLHVLPETIQQVQVLTGYPLLATPLYTFVIQYLDWLASRSQAHQSATLSLKNFLQHPYWRAMDVDVQRLTTWLTDQGVNYAGLPAWTKTTAPFDAFLHNLPLQTAIIPHLTKCVKLLQTRLHITNSLLPAHEVASFLACFECMEAIAHSAIRIGSPEAAKKLWQQLAPQYNVQLSVPDKKGIMIMPMSLTKALDFEHIMLIGMNEGSYPVSPSMSLIPTSWHQEKARSKPAVYANRIGAYAFYRLLQRAKNVLITYQAGIGQSGEMSRYVQQLLADPSLPTTHRLVSRAITPSAPQCISIKKEKPVWHALQEWMATHIITPSAINTYIDCPLQFYLRYLAKVPLKPDDNTLMAQHFGKCLHEVLEGLYSPYQGEVINLPMVKQLQKQVKPRIAACMPYYMQVLPQSYSSIFKQLIEVAVAQSLERDAADAPFTLIGTEIGKKKKLTTTLFLPTGQAIQLGGIIDRIDQKEGVIRIIDYKTSLPPVACATLPQLFTPERPSGAATTLQLLWYSWLFKRAYPSCKMPIKPLVRSTRLLNQEQKDRLLTLKIDGKRVAVHAIEPYSKPFAAHLVDVLTACLDPKVPFVSHSPLGCKWCPYQGLCQSIT